MDEQDQHLVRVPQINANEEEVEVVELHVGEGDFVETGDAMCTFESTKTALELEAPGTGYVRRLELEVGDRLEVGQRICVLTPTVDQSVERFESDEIESDDPDVRATRRAEELIGEYELEAESIEHTGIVTERDVVQHLERDGRDLRASTDRPEFSNPAVRNTTGEAIVVYGAGGHARVVIDMIREGRRDLEIVGIIDDADDPPTDVMGVPVIGDAHHFSTLRDRGVELAALGIGAVTHNALRKELFERLERNDFRIPNLIHPEATVEPSVSMGRGNQIFGGAVVSSNARLEDNNIVNSNAVVSHDCHLGDHVHLTPGSVLAGNVRIGDKTVIGMGATVYLGVDIGSDVLVTNGNHILENVEDEAVVRASQSEQS